MASANAVVLPDNARPNKYSIELRPDLDQFTFQGEETIDPWSRICSGLGHRVVLYHPGSYHPLRLC